MDDASTTSIDVAAYEDDYEDGGEEPGCNNPGIVNVQFIMYFTFYTDSILLLLSIPSVMLHLYVLRRAITLMRQSGCGGGAHHATDECLHIFLASMSTAELLLTAICYPAEIIPRAVSYRTDQPYTFPMAVHITIHVLIWTSMIGSSLSLVMMNLDKLFYFKYPFRYHDIFTRRRARYITLGIWLFAALFVAGAWLTRSFQCKGEGCETLGMMENSTLVYVLFMCSVCVAPIVTSLLVGVYTMQLVAQHRRKYAQEAALLDHVDTSARSSGGEATSTTNAGHCVAAAAAAVKAAEHRHGLRTFYFIFCTSVFTAVTLLPYRLVGIERALYPNKSRDCVMILYFWLLVYLIFINSIFNPLLTVSVLPQYRLRWRWLFAASKRRFTVTSASIRQRCTAAAVSVATATNPLSAVPSTDPSRLFGGGSSPLATPTSAAIRFWRSAKSGRNSASSAAGSGGGRGGGGEGGAVSSRGSGGGLEAVVAKMQGVSTYV